MSIEAMKNAFYDLERSISFGQVRETTLSSLRAAIEDAEKATPVAWANMPKTDDWLCVSGAMNPNGKPAGEWFPLYTHPFEADALRAEVKNKEQAEIHFRELANALEAQNEALCAENAELRRDAERYRWLRDNNDLHPGTSAGLSVKTDLLWKYSEAELDAAIDKATSRSESDSPPARP